MKQPRISIVVDTPDNMSILFLDNTILRYPSKVFGHFTYFLLFFVPSRCRSIKIVIVVQFLYFNWLLPLLLLLIEKYQNPSFHIYPIGFIHINSYRLL